MKKFTEWMIEKHPDQIEWISKNHPEMLDENMLRKAVAGMGIAAGLLGGVARPDNITQPKPAAVQQIEDDEDEDDEDEDFDDFVDGDINAEKRKMLKMAGKVPMTKQNIQGMEVSRGSAHMSGGKIYPNLGRGKLPQLPSGPTSSRDLGKKLPSGPKSSKDSGRKLPQLPSGPTSSRDLGGSVE